MYETKLPMTEEEICRNYRSAKSPKEQINILADLNVTDRRTIIDILYRHGELSSNAIGAYIRHGQLPESARPTKPASKEKKKRHEKVRFQRKTTYSYPVAGRGACCGYCRC